VNARVAKRILRNHDNCGDEKPRTCRLKESTFYRASSVNVRKMMRYFDPRVQDSRWGRWDPWVGP